MNLREFAWRMGYPIVTVEVRYKIAANFSQFREEILSLSETDEMPIEVVDMAHHSFKYPKHPKR